MEEVLHGHVPGQITEQRDAIIGTSQSIRIAERRHRFAVRHELVEALDATPCRGDGRALTHGIHADLLCHAVVVPEAAGDALEQALRVGHVSVIRENPLRRDVRQRHNTAPFVDGIEVFRHGQCFVQTDRAHVQRGLQPVVIDVRVMLALPHVRAHANAVQDEVDFSAEVLHGAFEQLRQILDACGIRRDDWSIANLLGKVMDFPHPHRHRGVRQHDFSALSVRLQRGFPSNALVVEGSENDALLAFEEVFSHIPMCQVEPAKLVQIRDSLTPCPLLNFRSIAILEASWKLLTFPVPNTTSGRRPWWTRNNSNGLVWHVQKIHGIGRGTL